MTTTKIEDAENDDRTNTGERVISGGKTVDMTSHGYATISWWTADGTQEMSAQFHTDGDAATIRDDDEAEQMIDVVTNLSDVPINVIDALEDSEDVTVEA